VLGLEFSTVIFQAINFFVLLGVLSWFFYRPLQRIMRQRESAIADRIDLAERRAREAESEKQRLAAREQEVAARAEELMAAARKRAGDERDRMLEEARQEAARLIDAATRSAREREASVLSRAESHVADAAVNIAANLIRSAAGEQIHRTLLERLFSSGLPAGPSSQLLLDDARTSGELVVESAYPLAPDERDRLEALVAATTHAPAPTIEVRVDPSLVGGVRILSRDLVADMSLRRALEDLRAGAPEAT
jgi:F-type H+-transporting ATPase subunit b